MKNNRSSHNNNNFIKKFEDKFTDDMIRDTSKFQEIYEFELENGSAWNNEADAFSL